jgi:hypothetical protein
LQLLLLFLQVGHVLLALLALLTLLVALALLSTLTLLSTLAPLILALLEGAVAQLLLPADHVAELVEGVVVVAVALLLLAHLAHLHVLQHLLEFLEHFPRFVSSKTFFDFFDRSLLGFQPAIFLTSPKRIACTSHRRLGWEALVTSLRGSVIQRSSRCANHQGNASNES